MNDKVKRAGPIWATITVGVIAVTALALSFVALNQDKINPDPDPGYTFTPGPELAPTVEAPAEDDPQQEPLQPVELIFPKNFLLLTDSKTLVRGKFGDCPTTPATLEKSILNPLSWQPQDLAANGVTEILGVYSGANDQLQFTVLDAECNPSLIQSFTAGASWEPSGIPVDQIWYFDRSTPTVIHTPLGALDAPCSVIQMSIAEQQTALLCADHRIATSTDLGQSWSTPIAIPGAQAIAATNDSVLALTANVNECAGIAVQTVNVAEPETPEEPGSCNEFPDITPGSLSIATDATDVVVGVGDTLTMSNNGGKTWM